MKIKALSYAVLFLLLASLLAGSLQQQTTSLGQVSGSVMINGVLAHQMSSAKAQLLANSNISWVSGDVTFNPSDISQWSQIYSLAQQNHLNLMGILDQHLMNNTGFTLGDWTNAVTQAVQAFGGVKVWEIWNEPNFADNTLGYFDGSPQAYVDMLRTAYNVIKAAAPSDTVIGLGGMPLYDSGIVNGVQTMNYYTNQSYIWASQVVQLGGMNYCDAVAVHAYPYGMYFSFLAGATFTNYMQQYSQLCGKPVWVTEVGQESSSSTWAATQDQQASFLNQSYNLLRSAGAKAYFWYELADNYAAGSASNSYFGLFDSSGNSKEAWGTYVAVVNGQPASTATSTQNPSITSSPKPSTSLSQSPSSAATPTATPSKSVPEENYAAALVAILIISIAAAISTYLKKHRA